MLGAARPVEGEPFLSRRPHSVDRSPPVRVGGAGRARGRAAHLYPPRCLSRRGPSFALVAGSRASMAWSRDATGCRARRGISRVGVAGGVGGRAPNSLLAGFPQLHVRLRSRRAERRARNTALRWSWLSCSAACWQTPIAQTLAAAATKLASVLRYAAIHPPPQLQAPDGERLAIGSRVRTGPSKPSHAAAQPEPTQWHQCGIGTQCISIKWKHCKQSRRRQDRCDASCRVQPGEQHAGLLPLAPHRCARRRGPQPMGAGLPLRRRRCTTSLREERSRRRPAAPPTSAAQHTSQMRKTSPTRRRTRLRRPLRRRRPLRQRRALDALEEGIARERRHGLHRGVF